MKAETSESKHKEAVTGSLVEVRFWTVQNQVAHTGCVVGSLVALLWKSDACAWAPTWLHGDREDLVSDAGCLPVLVHYATGNLHLLCATVVNLLDNFGLLTVICSSCFLHSVLEMFNWMKKFLKGKSVPPRD